MGVSTQTPSKSEQIAGTVHRFGKNGVLYEVLHEIDNTSVMIRVLDTNEETLYPIADVLKDPVS